MRLKGKVAIVTGASLGIGAAIALRFVREGCDLSLVTAHDLEGLKRTERTCREMGRRVIAFQCDISVLAQIDPLMDRTVAELGGLDILVNNAGITPRSPFEETREEVFDRIFATNVKGPYFLCQKAVPHMLRRGGGKIVNLSSTFGSVGAQGFSAYCASKGAVIHLTQALALELAPIGIAVNALAPGATGTEPVLAFYKANPGVREKRLRDIPAGRLATPEEMAEAALFLASDESGYIHGHNLVVDGGYLIH